MNKYKVFSTKNVWRITIFFSLINIYFAQPAILKEMQQLCLELKQFSKTSQLLIEPQDCWMFCKY